MAIRMGMKDFYYFLNLRQEPRGFLCKKELLEFLKRNNLPGRYL